MPYCLPVRRSRDTWHLPSAGSVTAEARGCPSRVTPGGYDLDRPVSHDLRNPGARALGDSTDGAWLRVAGARDRAAAGAREADAVGRPAPGTATDDDAWRRRLRDMADGRMLA